MNLFLDTISPWLDHLNFDWGPLIEQASLKKYPLNAHVYNQGDLADYVFIVLSGRVRHYIVSSDGREKAIAIAGKNCLIGENRIGNENTYFDNAVTASTATLAQIPYLTFETILYNNPYLVKQYVDLQNIKLQLSSINNLQLSYGSSVNRIYDAFFHLAMTYGRNSDEGITILIQFTHQELANLIGTSRVTVANTVNDMLRDNLLMKKGRLYHIPDIKKLSSKNI